MVVPGCPDCDSLDPITDPLVAAVLHNRRHIPIGRLPEELILCIMDYLTRDIHIGLCLGKVSRQFRRLVIRPIPGNHILGWNYANELEVGGMQVEYGLLKLGYPEVHKEVLSGTRRDQLCDTCLVLSIPNSTAGVVTPLLCEQLCKFNLWETDEVYCAGCRCNHPEGAFSMQGRERQSCIGREGFARVCQHKQVSWSQIEHLVEQAMAHDNGVVGFEEYYEHPSHRACPSSTPPHFQSEWRVGESAQEIAQGESVPIYLHIRWESHSRVSEANLDDRGRLRAPFLRSLFQDTAIVRQPPLGTESYMGMSCFSHFLCRCVHYETGNDLERSGVSAVKETVEDTNATGFKCCLRKYPYIHGVSNDRLCHESMTVRLCAETPSVTQDHCIVVKYYRRILIHRLEKGSQIASTNPTHEWLHALDTENLGSVLGCRNPECAKYFRSYQVLRCSEPPKGICDIGLSNSYAGQSAD
jgi:hypothetical protein